MSLKKMYYKNKKFCKVTFSLPKEMVGTGRVVYVLGDFNAWNPQADQMQPDKNGSFTKSLDLMIEQSYEFRYLIDNQIWKNEVEADRFAPSPYADSENSVVMV
jgi:1,4-alpha-glucan branching enzyme